MTTKREELTGCYCDVCVMEFPHAEPNPAIADVTLPSVGWVYVCAGHCPSGEEEETEIWSLEEMAEPAVPPMDKLWEATHSALLEGRWSTARALIDDLNRHHSSKAVDELPSLASLPVACHPAYIAVVEDRIGLWNARAHTNKASPVY